MSLSEFLMPLEVRIFKLGEDDKYCCLLDKAYGVDKRVGGDKNHTLHNKLGMGSSPCCDYIVAEDSRVILVEDSNLKIKKDEGWPMKDMEKEQVSKARSSLVILNCLIHECRKAKELMENKPVYFWLVINDICVEDAGSVIFVDAIQKALINLLKPFVSVKVLSLARAKTEFKLVNPIMA